MRYTSLCMGGGISGLMRLAPTLKLAVTLVGLAACSPVVSLTYTPTHAVVPGSPSLLAAVSVMDARGEEPDVLLSRPNSMGIIPVAYTHRPVADEVATLFTKALQMRGMVAAAAPYRVRLTLNRLGGNTFFNAHIYDDPETDDYSAEVGIDLAVTDQSGRIIYQDKVRDSRDLNVPAGTGGGGTLPSLLQALLNADVDELLDNPAFRTAIQHR